MCILCAASKKQLCAYQFLFCISNVSASKWKPRKKMQLFQLILIFQDLKDEALAIRLAADIASKRALEDVTKSTTTTSGSSSRQRIRDILQKQREDQDKRKDDHEVERKVSSAFDPSSRKLLWVFR